MHQRFLGLKLLNREHTFQTTNELVRSAISFCVVQPPLTDTSELLLEPSRDDVDGNTTAPVRLRPYLPARYQDLPFTIVINAGNLLGSDCRIPRPRKQCRN